jgi:hypothetical protein
MADDGATPFQAIKPECRRCPISQPVFYQTPFWFPAAFRLSKHHLQIKFLSVHDMPYRFSQLVSQSFPGFRKSAGRFFTLIPCVNLRIEPGRKKRGQPMNLRIKDFNCKK